MTNAACLKQVAKNELSNTVPVGWSSASLATMLTAEDERKLAYGPVSNL
jgi:hypothetical protein